MNQIFEYIIGNNEEYNEDYSSISIFTAEEIPEWEWKKLLADAEKACLQVNIEVDDDEEYTFYSCDYGDIASYILEHDKGFFQPTVKAGAQIGYYSDNRNDVGVQHYFHK